MAKSSPSLSSDNPIALLAALDLGALRARVEALDRERKALVVLIRSASRRAAPTRGRTKGKAVCRG